MLPSRHPDELIVVETDTAFWVAYAQDPTDWLACFLKSHDFPARDWAERMVAVQGQRLNRPPDRSEAER